MRGFLAVVEMAFRLFFRDKHGLFWGVAFPLMLMALIGTVFSSGTNLVLTTSVVADAGDPMARELTEALRQIETLRIVDETEPEALEALRRGDRSLVVVLPTVAEVAAAGGTAPVRVYYDEASYEIAQAGIAIVRSVVEEANKIMTGRRDVLTVDASGISAYNLTMFDFLLPGVLAMVLMQNGLMGVTAVLTAYRERLLLKRVLATPFPPGLFLAGLVARFTITNLLQGAIIVLVGVLVFRAQVVGSYLNMFLLSVIGSVAFLSIGFAVSTLSATPDGANTFGSALTFPMMFLSGTFWPREFIPDALQPVIDLLPLTPLVEALRGVATHGHGLEMHWPGMLYLAGWGAVAMVLAVRRFRWE
ncbi:MAG: ABC transporter permease [Limnochordales bacterium]|nr:MAG: hypothetical protein DIU83_07870 [Bacillota bacterium]